MGLKEEGNDAFKAGRFEEAVKLYSRAIEEEGQNEVLYSNRSASLLALKRHDEARRDADKCIELKPDWAKGHYRRSRVHEENNEFELAVACMRKALELDPSNNEIQRRLKDLNKMAKSASAAIDEENIRKMFEKAGMKSDTDSDTDEEDNKRHFDKDINPQGWAKGLTPEEQRIWLVDCYRMRADDDYVWGGCFLHGLYCTSGKQPIVEDFLVFCKLAVEHKVVPEKWDWKKFLETAKDPLRFAFEKEDAKEKYGSENVFAGALGGRSLRFTAEFVYGSSCMAGMMGVSDRHQELLEQADGEWRTLSKPSKAAFFDDVGGQNIWIDFFRNMKNPPTPRG